MTFAAGIERFVIEFFRAKDDRFGWAFGLSTAQLIALAIVVTGIGVMVARKTIGPNRPGPSGRYSDSVRTTTM